LDSSTESKIKEIVEREFFTAHLNTITQMPDYSDVPMFQGYSADQPSLFHSVLMRNSGKE